MKSVLGVSAAVSLVVLFASPAGAHVMSLPVANYSFEPSDAQPSVADGESTTTIAGWATDSPSLVVRNPSSAEFAGADGNGALPAPADGSQAAYNTSTLDSANLIGSALSIPATWQDGTPIGNGAGGLQQGVTYTITVAIGHPLNSTFASNVVVEVNTPTFGEGMFHYGYSFGVPPTYHPAIGDFEDFTCAFNFDNLFDNGGGFYVNVGDSITPSINIGPGTYVDNVRVTISDVPEPSTLVLLGMGAVSLLAYAWRNKKSMSKKFSCRRCFLTAIVSVATVTIAAGSASADTLGYFWGVNVSANGGDSLSPQFDPSLGTLQSVTLTAFALVMPDPVYLQNQNPEVGGTVSVTTTVGWGLFAGEDRMNLVSSGGSVSASGSVAPFGSGSGNMMPPPDTFVELMPSVSTPSQTTTLYSGFADFVGNGFVALDGEVDVQTSWTSDPASLSLVWTNAPVPGSQPSGYISGTLLYTFSPVPEPCTLVLLGIGAVSLLAYAWRRRTTKP